MNKETHHDHSTHGMGHGDGLGDQADKPFTDPVCGMKVAANPERKIDYAGQSHYFCSHRCKDKFQANPQQYLQPRQENSAQETVAGTIYTCPMHPEIRQAQAGNCPLCGMALEPLMPELEEKENPELIDFRRRFWWTLPLSFLVMVLAMASHRFSHGGIPYQNWIELALSTPVVLWAGWPFFVRWAQSIKNRSPNMWTLIGSGTGAAYAYSVVATVAPEVFPPALRQEGHVGVCYEAAAVIVSLTLLG
jgi:Cu+-exporting ATPase